MVAAELPPDEELRLRTLYAYEILDTIEEPAFDDICEVAAAICDTPTSLFTLLDRNRQWFKARKGFDLKETSRDCSFCAHAILDGALMVVENAVRDSRFVENQLVVSAPHVRFYAGVPIRAHNGQPLGALCVIDTRPRTLDSRERGGLEALAHRVEHELELRRAQRDHALVSRFLIHDLRNHLTGMLLGIQEASSEARQGRSDLADLQRVDEATQQVARQVDNFHSLLAADHGALPLQIASVDVVSLVDALRAAMAPRLAESSLTLETSTRSASLRGDPDLLRRLLENLVDNAIKVSPPGSTIRIEIRHEGDRAVLRVRDEGPGVPEEQRDTIFEAGVSGAPDEPRTGTGLGLAFCRMATNAMGGHIGYEAPESGSGAVFRVSLPA